MAVSRVNNQPQISEVPVKGKAGHIVEHMCNDHIGYGVAKRKLLILGEFLEDLLRSRSHRVIIPDE